MNYTEITQDIYFGLGVDATGYPIIDLTRNVNSRYNDVVSGILEVDQNWKWDDSNQTDLPIGTTSLVSGQPDYQIAGGTFLKILRVEILDNNGTYQLIHPFDEQNETELSLTQYAGTNGLPTTYRKLGDSIILYPTPATGSVTLAAGLKVYYQRPPSYFLTSDTTKTPGFNPLYHKLLSYGGQIDYAVANNMSQKINTLVPLYEGMYQKMMTAYARRPAEQKPQLRVRQNDTR